MSLRGTRGGPKLAERTHSRPSSRSATASARRTWQVREVSSRGISSVGALQKSLLRTREVPQATHFFTPDFNRDTHDPLLLSDITVARDRIFAAIAKKEHVLVYGDYDADGISSTALLVSVLTQLGARVTPFLPHRIEHGYGLHGGVLSDVAADIDLLIAVDCGIANATEIEFLRRKKVDTIVVDHHALPTTLPPALAILHPRHPQQLYPFAWLCGAGLSWKLAQALLRDPRAALAQKSSIEDMEKWLLDLAVIGTVADVVPLQGENRAITHFGLEVLKRTQRPGLRSLLLRARCVLSQLSARDLAFQLIPKLNAAGRMDHPQPALDLLLAETSERAEELLTGLESLNNRRRTLSRRVVDEAEAQLLRQDAPVLVVAGATWPAGVVGLAAAKLAERFGRPAIVVGQAGDKMVGSARSPEGSNVLEILTAATEYLERLGGHAHAAGFTVRGGQLENFKAAVTIAGQSRATPEHAGLTHTADAIVDPALLKRQTVDMLRTFAPFGEGNEEPRFVIRDLELAAWRIVGRDGKHAKCSFTHEAGLIDGIAFGLAPQMREEIASQRGAVDVLCALEENEFRGRTMLQLDIHDIAPAGKVSIMQA